MQPQPDSFRNNLCWRVWTRQLKLPPPSTSKHSMTRRNPQPVCASAKCSPGSRRVMAAHSSRTQWPTVMNPTVSEIEKSSPTSQHDDDDSEPIFALPRKSRLSAPRLQAQLSQLFDRTRLRRNLLTKGAWQQVTRIEDLCHTHVSNTWLNHIDACAGSVLTPQDYITNVQRRLGNRAYTGFGQCRLCGSFLDSQLEHGESCSTAEATRGHYACVHAVLGGLRLADQESPRNPRGLTEAQSRLADLFISGAVPGRSAALDVCVWHPPMLQQPEGMRHTQPLIVKSHSTDVEFPFSGSGDRLPPPGVDRRRSPTPSRHPNPAIRSRHCCVPRRSSNVSKSAPA